MAARRAAAALFVAAFLTAAGGGPLRADGGAGTAGTGGVPCVAPEYHQFDFWIGDWEVTTLDGRRAGWNVVQRDLGGCEITENWTGARGVRGRSLNAYSASDGRWHQVWVDSRGTLLQLSGGLVDGDMVMSGESTTKAGTVLNRITWHRVDEDHVRQHWEQSSDGGASWTDVFLGLYARRKL